eukprot:TRINITY_DN434_c0_g1_i2.p1 TRINITY_DN434_c0_g1~~TRINITY_DN434_c0_g1_i2.p1  ORF type:complete len:256 (+),score=59.46 TRINITY_DN434_c0_g1_i2:96-770(+)
MACTAAAVRSFVLGAHPSQALGSCPSTSLRLTLPKTCRFSRRIALVCDATAGDKDVAKSAPTPAAPDAKAKPESSGIFSFPPLPSGGGNTFQDVMAFSGPAPELINGRLAMYAFVICGGAEVFQGGTIWQQFLSSPLGTISTTSFLVLASFIPSLLAEVPFAELQHAACREGMPGLLQYFHTGIEQLHGRIAMAAFLIMIIIEAATGAPTFGRAFAVIQSNLGL